MLFLETTPKRWISNIPGANMYYFLTKQDNNWVQMEMLADNKTFVGTTDDNRKLEIDPVTLETRELIKWQDDEYCITGVSHSKRLVDGNYYSICEHFDIHTMKMNLMLFKLEGENTFKRKRIA